MYLILETEVGIHDVDSRPDIGTWTCTTNIILLTQDGRVNVTSRIIYGGGKLEDRTGPSSYSGDDMEQLGKIGSKDIIEFFSIVGRVTRRDWSWNPIIKDKPSNLIRMC